MNPATITWTVLPVGSSFDDRWNPIDTKLFWDAAKTPRRFDPPSTYCPESNVVPNVIRRLQSTVSLTIAVVWLMLVVSGMRSLTEYANRPGDPGQPPIRLGDAANQRDELTLIMFAHPQCPCTRASIEELATLMARCESNVSSQVVFCRPEGADEDWVQSDLWVAASRIPGVEVIADEDCELVTGFGAATSGQVLLYDTDGTLVFQGGITAARGHVGDNAGSQSVLRLIRAAPGSCNENDVECEQVPVFGCPLVE